MEKKGLPYLTVRCIPLEIRYVVPFCFLHHSIDSMRPSRLSFSNEPSTCYLSLMEVPVPRAYLKAKAHVDREVRRVRNN